MQKAAVKVFWLRHDKRQLCNIGKCVDISLRLKIEEGLTSSLGLMSGLVLKSGLIIGLNLIFGEVLERVCFLF